MGKRGAKLQRFSDIARGWREKKFSVENYAFLAFTGKGILHTFVVSIKEKDLLTTKTQQAMNITPEEMDTLEEKTFKLRLRIAELERDLEEKTDVIVSQADKISKLEDEVKHLKEMLELVKSRPSVVMDNPTFQGPMYDQHDNTTVQNN